MRTGCGDRRGKPFPVDLSDVHVLIVDDNEDALDIFSTALGRSGANVLKARSGRDALTILTAVRVDVLVSDLAMPGEDGLWLIQQVRRLKSEHGDGLTAECKTNEAGNPGLIRRNQANSTLFSNAAIVLAGEALGGSQRSTLF